MTDDSKVPTLRDQGSGKGKKRRGRFYEAALTEMERLLLSEARELEGLDEEIALLRVKLLTALSEQPQNYELHLKQAGMLVKAVSARYKLGEKAQQDLYDSIDGVLKNLGVNLLPPAGRN